MTREEEIKNESYKYGLSKYSDGISAMICASDFEAGAEWADSHPCKEHVELNEVCDWIQNNAFKYWEETAFYTSNLISDLRKAMLKVE